MTKDASKPISFRAVQKNKKLGEFNSEENKDLSAEEKLPID